MQKMGNRIIPEKGEGEGSRSAIRSVLVTSQKQVTMMVSCVHGVSRTASRQMEMCRKNICEEEEEVGFGIH